VNVVILTGNLARDPDTRYTPKGTAVTEATICVSEKRTDDAGQVKEITAYVGLVFFGPRAEAFARHHRKGSRAFIRGKIVQDSWEDKATGKRQTKTKVQVEDWEFAERKPADSPPPPPPSRFVPRNDDRPPSSEWPAPGADTPGSGAPPPEDDDVPF
jgi:single-strand DNA-binding protein